MGILRRANDILAANVNDLVERFEHPEKMLRQAVRELETAISTVLAAVARSIAAEKMLARQYASHREQASAWQCRAQTAVAACDDTLARQAIARRLDHERLAARLDRQLEQSRAANQSLRRQVDTLRSRHTEARSKLATLFARQTAADARRQASAGSSAVGFRIAALERMDRLVEKIEWSEAEAQALSDLEGSTDDLTEQFDCQEAEQAIEIELASLKAHKT